MEHPNHVLFLDIEGLKLGACIRNALVLARISHANKPLSYRVLKASNPDRSEDILGVEIFAV